MPGYVPPALRPLLGGDLSDIDEANLERLVGFAESEWFDAKRDPYGKSDSQRRDLAADVAAFANRQGGLIAIGLDETDAGGVVASTEPLDQENLNGEELRMTQVISSLVAPVPSFSIRTVAAASGGGYLLVSIPPSKRRPHCVVVGSESVRYPLREGTHKRYLAESEIADLYRSRFADARSQVDAVRERHRAMAEMFDREQSAWLVVTMEPDWPGSASLTREGLGELRLFDRTQPVQFPTWFRGATYTPTPSLRSALLMDQADGGIYSSAAKLHVDGGGSVGHGWHRGEEVDAVVFISDEDIVGCLVNTFWSLADWAINRAGTAGDATVVVEVLPPLNFESTLWQYRAGHGRRLEGARNLTVSPGAVERTVTLESLLSSPQDLLLTVRSVTAEIESAFGVFGPNQIDEDGSLLLPYFYRDKHDWLRQWGEAFEVHVIEEV
jgi:hypothetical protein